MTDLPQWQALDREETHLKADHAAQLERLEKQQQKARTRAERDELGLALADIEGARQDAMKALRARRTEWQRLNAEQLTKLCRGKEAELVVEVGRLVRGHTAAERGEKVRGLAALTAEADVLRSSFCTVVNRTRPDGRQLDAAELTPGELVDQVLSGAGLLPMGEPVPVDQLATVRPVGALALADEQPAAQFSPVEQPWPDVDPSASFQLHRNVGALVQGAEQVDREDLEPAELDHEGSRA